MPTPAVIFPDTELYLTTYLRTALAARPEAYASGVTVATTIPNPRGTRMIAVRRDGGTRQDVIRETARMSLRIFADTEQNANDLTRLVRALVGACAGATSSPVVAVRESGGPVRVEDPSGQHLRLVSFDLTVRGINT